MHEIVIRQMQYEDVDAVVEIYDEVFDGTYIGFGELAVGMGISPGVPSKEAPEIFRTELNDLLCDTSINGLFVACNGNHVIGFAVAVLHPSSVGRECWLNDLGVSHTWRRHRVGCRLVERILAWAFKEKNAGYCLLESGVKNENAHKLFGHLGFRPLSTVFYLNSSSGQG